MADEWLDIELPAASGSEGEWQDVAIGPESPSFLGSIWQGVKNAPGAIWDTVKSVPSGVSNLYHLPGDLYNAGVDATGILNEAITGEPFIPRGTPEESAERYGRAERTFRGAAGVGTGIASWGVGGAAGAAAGNTGLNMLLEAVGVNPETSAEQDLSQLGQDLGTNLVFSVAGQAAPKVKESVAKIANQLDRKSIGARQSDYGTASSTRTVVTPEGGIESFTKAALDDLLENGKLGASRDPVKMLQTINSSSEAIASEIGKKVAAFDKTGTPIKPEFNGALEYIYKEVPADQIAKYIDKLDDFEKAIEKEGGGRLSFLQDQKMAIGKSYDLKDAVKAGYERALYDDLKTTIEGAVPEVQGLNADLAKYITAKPIIERALVQGENASLLQKAQKLTFTTGGLGAPTLIGSMLGGAPGAVVGSALSGGLALLASPKAQSLAAKVLRNGAELPASALPGLLQSVLGNQGPQDAASIPRSVIGGGVVRSDPQGASSDRLQPALALSPSAANIEQGAQLLAESKMQSAKDLPKGSVDSPSFKPTAGSGANQYAFVPTLLNGLKEPKTDSGSLVEAVIWQESRGKSDAVSPKGAQGIMQIMPATAKEIANELGIEKYDLKDPETNRQFGEYYLNKMLKMFDGDEALALAAYNAGPNAVQKWIDRWGNDWTVISHELEKRGWYEETRKYVPSILKKREALVVV